jgi:hypothetical protein
MTNQSRQLITEVNNRLVAEGKNASDSPAKLFGSDGHGISSVCETYLEMSIAGSTNGTMPVLPDAFSSPDFLSGCNDSGKALLASG